MTKITSIEILSKQIFSNKQNFTFKKFKISCICIFNYGDHLVYQTNQKSD